jgi:hypothetical protein
LTYRELGNAVDLTDAGRGRERLCVLAPEDWLDRHSRSPATM